jgi:hypothetical protein
MTDRKKAEIICSEIREYMSRFIDTDEKVVDMLCDIVSENLIKEENNMTISESEARLWRKLNESKVNTALLSTAIAHDIFYIILHELVAKHHGTKINHIVADDSWDAIEKGQICEAIEVHLDSVLDFIAWNEDESTLKSFGASLSDTP